jgi:hypothetical protein
LRTDRVPPAQLRGHASASYQGGGGAGDMVRRVCGGRVRIFALLCVCDDHFRVCDIARTVPSCAPAHLCCAVACFSALFFFFLAAYYGVRALPAHYVHGTHVWIACVKCAVQDDAIVGQKKFFPHRVNPCNHSRTFTTNPLVPCDPHVLAPLISHPVHDDGIAACDAANMRTSISARVRRRLCRRCLRHSRTHLRWTRTLQRCLPCLRNCLRP